MKKSTSKIILIYIIGALFFFLFGSLIFKSPSFFLYWGLTLILFSMIFIILLKKIAFLEVQNNINLERFEISMEHVNHVLFDNVLEADITNDCLIGENAEKLTQLLHIPTNSTYSQTIDAIAKEMVDERYGEEYRRILSVEHILETLRQGHNTLEFECIERSDGKTYRWIRAHYCIYKSNVTNCVKIISYVKNIEEEKNAYNRLIEKATTDSMTGLLNKISTKDIIQNLLQKNTNHAYILLMIDIDDFKNINDTYGHDIGDEVIISICKMIQNNFRDTSIIGRMGGDEFLVCLPDTLQSNEVIQAVEQLLHQIQDFQMLHKRHTVEGLTVSIGIVWTFENHNFDQLFHYADVAMYQAKAKGKNQFVVYNYTN